MDTYDFSRLIYLVVLGAAVLGYFIAQNRGNWNKMAQQAAVWGLIFVGVIAGYGLWSDIQKQVAPQQSVLENGQIEVPRELDGHFHVTAEVNGKPVRFIVDTGATDVVLTEADAKRVGINPDTLAFSGSASTANGRVTTAPAYVDELRLGPVKDSRFRVYVNGGQMEESLLGMSYLSLFSKVEMTGDTLVLTR
jgi:aspartyl protease family protein